MGTGQGVRRDGSIADRSGRLSEFVRRWVFAGAPVVLPVGGARPRRLMARVRPPAENSPVSAPQQSIDKASADLVRMPASASRSGIRSASVSAIPRLRAEEKPWVWLDHQLDTIYCNVAQDLMRFQYFHSYGHLELRETDR